MIKFGLPCFKQLQSTISRISLLIRFIAGERLLLDVKRGLRLLSDKPFDFHAEIRLLLPIFLKRLKSG